MASEDEAKNKKLDAAAPVAAEDFDRDERLVDPPVGAPVAANNEKKPLTLSSAPWRTYLKEYLLQEFGPSSHYSQDFFSIANTHEFARVAIDIEATLERKGNEIIDYNKQLRLKGWSESIFSEKQLKQIICQVIRDKTLAFFIDPDHPERLFAGQHQQATGNILKICAAYKIHLYSEIHHEFIKIYKDDQKALKKEQRRIKNAGPIAEANKYKEIAKLFTQDPEKFIQDSKSLPKIRTLDVETNYPTYTLLENSKLIVLDNNFKTLTDDTASPTILTNLHNAKTKHPDFAKLLEKLQFIRQIEKNLQHQTIKNGIPHNQCFEEKIANLNFYFNTALASSEHLKKEIGAHRDSFIFKFFSTIRRFILYYIPHPLTPSAIPRSEGAIRFGQIQKLWTTIQPLTNKHLKEKEIIEQNKQEIEQQAEQRAVTERAEKLQQYKDALNENKIYLKINDTLTDLKENNSCHPHLIKQWEVKLQEIFSPVIFSDEQVLSIENAEERLQRLQNDIDYAAKIKQHFTPTLGK